MNDYKTNRGMTPVRAIIIYTGDSEYYLESRDIKKIDKKLQLLAPQPLSDTMMKDIAKLYAKNNSADMKHGSLIDSNMLYACNEPGKLIVMWYRPAMKRSLNFSKGTNLPAKAIAWVPATLYIVHNTKLYIFALMTDERPTGDTKIYKAPFGNIYVNGNVCIGSAHIGKRRAKTFEKEAARYERGFYMAEQNQFDGKNMTKTPMLKLWGQLIKSKEKFPSKKELKKHEKYETLEDIIEDLLGNEYDSDDDFDYFDNDNEDNY